MKEYSLTVGKIEKYFTIFYSMQFEWSAKKELTNVRKHNITFSEAKTVFNDEFAILEYDSVHSEKEERFHLLGRSIKHNISKKGFGK